MRFSILALTLLLTQIPKNSPNGIWESTSGVQYEIRQNGADVRVKMVPGSNSKYLQYDVTLKNQDEINTYKGTGTFVAKMESGKECKFETEWQLVVVSPDRILGSTTGVQADKNTCAIKEKNEAQLDLKKKK
jgi:hypothetical protein